MGAGGESSVELSEPLDQANLLLVDDLDARGQEGDEQRNDHQNHDELGHGNSCKGSWTVPVTTRHRIHHPRSGANLQITDRGS